MKAAELISHISSIDSYKYFGKVTQVMGLMIESRGPESSIGDVCYIYVGRGQKKKIMAEVVGFRDEFIVLMPFTNVEDIALGSIVETTNKPLEIKIGSSLIGSILDPLGFPVDGSGLPKGLKNIQTVQDPPNPMMRPPICSAIETGVRAIDIMLTVGKGQRLGIFAGSGVGKSTLMGMIARNTSAKMNVIALIGERGREVREFIERDLGPEGMKRSIVVVATSDQPALMRLKAAYTATTIAEYFRDLGMDVMFLLDSTTRIAMAQREIGLAIGEPPTTKGYPPSVFGLMPRLLERTGTNNKGSITAFYTVLVDGDDMNEPITDCVRGILDGHLVLDRRLANKGQYPAINVLASVSRVMNHIVSKEHQELAVQTRSFLSTYQEAEDLINIGAYKKGSSPNIDAAIQYHEPIRNFLMQATDEKVSASEALEQLKQIYV